MAGRPPLPIGAHGKFSQPRQLPSGAWEVSCRVRDADGVTRKVKRQGRSRTAAANALREALAERTQSVGEQLTGESLVSVAAAAWLDVRADDVASGHLARSTLERYAMSWRLDVAPALGALRLREASVQRCETWARALRQAKSAETARTGRTVLSGVLGYAARMGAIASNPVRDISPIRSTRRSLVRALTREEVAALLAVLDASVQARRADLPDLVRFMLATGVRLGEALAVSWDEVDLDAGAVAIAWHLVPVRGEGLQRVAGAKSAAGTRTLRLPRWAVTLLLARRIANDGAWPVFPDLAGGGGWRWPNNVARSLRRVRTGDRFAWVTSHAFRKTCLTLLDAAGHTPRVLADVAGHSDPSMTQRVYMGRGTVHEATADVLGDLFPGTG